MYVEDCSIMIFELRNSMNELKFMVSERLIEAKLWKKILRGT